MFFKKDDKKQEAENLPPLNLDNLQMPQPLSNNLEAPASPDDLHLDVPSPEEFGISSETPQSSTMNIAKNAASQKKGFFKKMFGKDKNAEVAMPKMPEPMMSNNPNQAINSPQTPQTLPGTSDNIPEQSFEPQMKDENIEKLDDLEKHLANYMTSLENKDNLKTIPQSISTLPSDKSITEPAEEENETEEEPEQKTHEKPSFNKVEHEQIKKKIDAIESEIDAHIKEITEKIKIIKPLERKALEYVRIKKEKLSRKRSEKKVKKAKSSKKAKNVLKKKTSAKKKIANKTGKHVRRKKVIKKNKK